MRLNPIPLFKDRSTRPRAIIWSGLALIAFVLVWVAAIDGTSTYWFCTEPCHTVHADNTAAYQASSHTNVSCIACHEPVNGDPIHLTLLKIKVAPDVFDTIFKTFHMPINGTNDVALAMPTEQCTQCHNVENRTFTPDEGLLIDHDVHAENDIVCTRCHNRVAHPEEEITLTLAGNRKHDNWMTMDACFRCHSLEAEAADTPPGACEACHTPDFDLVPATHKVDAWYALYGDSSAHAKAARDESASVAAALKIVPEPVADEVMSGQGLENGSIGERDLVPSSAVNSCYTCHSTSYCSNCHGLDIPHPAEFKKDHKEQGFANSELCGRCHARSAEEAKGTGFCSACHHPESTPGKRWAFEHPITIKTTGATVCYDCHDERQCAYCHVNGISRYRAIEEELWEE